MHSISPVVHRTNLIFFARHSPRRIRIDEDDDDASTRREHSGVGQLVSLSLSPAKVDGVCATEWAFESTPPSLSPSLPRSPLTLDERRMRCGRRGKGGLKNQQCPRASKNMRRQLRDAQRHKMPGVIQRSRVASIPFRDTCHNN